MFDDIIGYPYKL